MTTGEQVLLIFAGLFVLWQLLLGLAWARHPHPAKYAPMGPGWIAAILLVVFVLLRR